MSCGIICHIMKATICLQFVTIVSCNFLMEYIAIKIHSSPPRKEEYKLDYTAGQCLQVANKCMIMWETMVGC